ncbi:MAG: ABC transporter ATP-binding protein [Trueperaceae bacterium]|nr:ABC transporter ATP-binding protein [Trueperaceae bacterium]
MTRQERPPNAEPGAEAGTGGARPEVALAALWRLMRPYRRRLAGLALLIAVSSGVTQLAPQFVRYVFDVVIPRGEARLFLLTGAAMAVFYVVSEGLKYAGMLLSFAFTQRIVNETRRAAYGRLLALPLSRFTRERSGSLVSRVVNDVNALEAMIQAGASRIIGHAFSILVVLVILFVMDWRLALVSVVIVALMGYFTVRFQEPLRRLARRIRGRVGEMSAVASEAVQNVAVVKSFGAEAPEFERFRVESDAYRDLNLARRREVGLMQGAIGLSSELGVAAMVLAGGWLIVQSADGSGGLTLGTLTAFVLYLNNLINPVRFLLNFNNQLQAGVAALERIDALLAETPEPYTRGEAFTPGDVTFRGVTFRYPGTEQAALQGLDLHVQRGSTAALVGPSGAGKSTVTRLLSRLYEPQDGQILVGDRPLQDTSLASVRRAVAVVPQEPTLFSGTVAENVRYGRPEATRAEIEDATRLANAEAFVRGLPRGFDTEIGERGVKLSGGQKQRIAIARALLKGAEILVLDEATSSLDSESEALIQDALDGVLGRREALTTLVIAHRLSTVQHADRIHVLEGGRMVEAGTHHELLARGGLYAHLHALQAGQKEVA